MNTDIFENIDEIVTGVRLALDPERLWTVRDIAFHCGWTENTARNKISAAKAKGEFPKEVFAGRYKQKEVKEWIDSQNKTKAGRRRAS